MSISRVPSVIDPWLIRIQNGSKKYKPHLRSPPPFPSVHVMVHLDGLIDDRIVSFRLENEVRRKIRITEQSSDAFDDIARVELKSFSCNNDLIAVELGLAGKLIIDYLVQFFQVLIGQV